MSIPGNKRVIVVGGGLGGLAGAIILASKGYRVSLYEKNATLGGKMNELRLGAYRFDTGPSLLTMPHVITKLFSDVGESVHNYLEFLPIDPLCRYFFPDGSQLDAHADSAKMTEALQRFSPKEVDNYHRFMKYSKKIYDLTAEVFLHTPFHEFRKILKPRFLKALVGLPQIDTMRTVHASVSRYFNDPRLIQLFDRYATYNGSNPFVAPATLNIIPYVEFGLGGFYIRGGMMRLAHALETLARKVGVEIYTNSRVTRIVESNRKIQGVEIDGTVLPADVVLCNADVVTAHTDLLHPQSKRAQSLRALEPSISGMVFFWGVRGTFPQLAHHSIIFSEDYRQEFTQIFVEHRAPDDPTIYIATTSKTDSEHAPDGCENWFILLNMPYLSDGQDWTKARESMRRKVIGKLHKLFGFTEDMIEAEHSYTPEDFLSLYASNQGSIYGLSSNSRNAAFRRPANRSREIQGLYFAGGSSHPGGGIPLVILSGMMAAELIAER